MNKQYPYIRPSFFDRFDMWLFTLLHGKEVPDGDPRPGPIEFYHKRGLLDYLRIVCPDKETFIKIWVPGAFFTLVAVLLT